MEQYLTFAHQLADMAGDIIRPYFGAHGHVAHKSDESPVTVADREAERAMRALIESHYPAHAIYGEEFGVQLAANDSSNSPDLAVRSALREPLADGVNTNTKNASRASEPSASAAAQSVGQQTNAEHSIFTWVIDPIDGTRAFIAGRKEWGTLIALCENGVPILGILDQPITGERWVGVKGQPTHYYSSPIRGEVGRGALGGMGLTTHRPHPSPPPIGEGISTRLCASLSAAELSTTSAAYFTPTQAARVVKLAQACRATVKDGDCYAYGLLARGLRDVVIDAGLKPYDILALVPIIEGAGGKITGWDGAAITLNNFREVIAVGDVRLQQVVLETLR